MDQAEYTVTKLAGPKVAGLVVKPGDTVTLTSAQAETERLSGAIVPKGKEDRDPLAGSGKIEGIRARARGEDDDTDEAIAAAQPQPAPPPPAVAEEPAKAAAAKRGAA